MGVTIGYNGSTIASMNASGTKTLLTSGKYCEGNISVVFQDSSGTPVPCRSFSATVAADQTDKTYLTSADSDIASHRSDSSFWVAVIPQFGYSSGLSFRGGFSTMRELRADASSPLYGVYLRTSSTGTASYGMITKAPTASGADVGVDSTGRIFVYASNSSVLRAGDYLCVCGW
jgi:hypothetical protein